MTYANLPVDEAARAQRARERPPCRVPGCTNQRDPNKLMCTTCWWKVPVEIRIEVLATWRRYLRQPEPLRLAEYVKHKEAAIAAAQKP